MRFDIVVCGGGIAGVMAAVSAAREGCSVLLADRLGYPGGMLTGGGVGPMMTFHAGDKQVVCGLTNELVERLVARGKSPGHIFDTTTYTYTVTPFDAEAMKVEMERMLLEAGVSLLYHAMLSDVYTDGANITRLTFTVKGGTVDAEAKLFIDATGDADLSYMAGVPCSKGMAGNGICQPMTMNMKLGNIDIRAVKQYIRQNPQDFPVMYNSAVAIDKAPRVSVSGFISLMEAARVSGEIDFERECVLLFETNNPGEVIVNVSRIKDFDPTDPWQLTAAEVEGRRQAQRVFAFLTRRVPGFADAVLLQTSPGQVGVRSSRQIEGLYTLTHVDLIRGVRFADSIAHGGYPIDVHTPKGGYSKAYLALTEEEKKMKPGHVYSVPYRCLLNDAVGNLITVGRCISAEFLAQSAIRVSPIAGAIGHGGGAAAAVAVKQSKSPADIDVRDVQRLLLAQDAYIEC